MSRPRLYLDHAATTPLSAAARDAMLPLLEAAYANPSSPHLEGRAAKDALEEARTRVAQVLACRPREVIFTSGASEAAAIALHGAAYAMAAAGRKRLLVSAVEYPTVLETADALGSMGLEVVRAPVDGNGQVDAQAFLDLVDDETAVAALMLVHHETGARQPAAEVAAALNERRIPLVCDAALAPGRLDIGRDALPAALLLLSGHKFGGPPGSGALIVRRGTRLAPFLHGGVQEEGLRPGMENVAACAGFAAALEEACAARETRAAALEARIADFLGALDELDGWAIAGPQTNRAPGIVTIELRDVEGEAAMINMDLEGIAVTTGSTCALGSRDPSPGLLAMGMSKRRASSTLRISAGHDASREDMLRAASTLRNIVARLRALARR